MKKLFICIALGGLMTSCYNSRVCVGNASFKEPNVKVKTVTNHHMIFGLVPGKNSKKVAKDYIGDKKDYIIINEQTFFNGFLGAITCGIYTPSITSFYIPAKDAGK